MWLLCLFVSENTRLQEGIVDSTMIPLMVLCIIIGLVLALAAFVAGSGYLGPHLIQKGLKITRKQITEQGEVVDKQLSKIDTTVDFVQNNLDKANQKMEKLRKKMAECLKQVTDIVQILETTAEWLSFAVGEISLLRACYVYSILLCAAIVQQHFLEIPLFCCMLESPVVLTLAVLYFERPNSNKGPLMAAVVIVGAIAVSIFLSYSRSAYVQFQIQSRAFFNDLILPLSMLFVAYFIFTTAFRNDKLGRESAFVKHCRDKLSKIGQNELNEGNMVSET